MSSSERRGRQAGERRFVQAKEVRRARDSALLAPLAICLALAGGIHLAAMGAHLKVAPVHSVFFLAVATGQLALAVEIARHPAPRLLAASALLSSGVAATWAVSRTVGVPFGPRPFEAEPVLLPDLAATALEVAAVALGFALLRPARQHRVARLRPALTGGLGAVLAGGAMAAMAFTFVTQPADAHSHGVTDADHGHATGKQAEGLDLRDTEDHGDFLKGILDVFNLDGTCGPLEEAATPDCQKLPRQPPVEEAGTQRGLDRPASTARTPAASSASSSRPSSARVPAARPSPAL